MPKSVIDFADPKVSGKVIQMLVDNTPAAFLILDKELRVHYVNDYFLKLRNINRKEALGNYSGCPLRC